MAAPSKITNTVVKPEKQKDTGRFITPAEGRKIVSAAKGWVDTPYAAKGTKYAGGNPLKGKNGGADCSGSVWAIYKEAGFPYGHYFNTVAFVNLVASDPNFITAWLQKLVGTDENFIQGKHFFKEVFVPQAGDIGWWKGTHADLRSGLGPRTAEQRAG